MISAVIYAKEVERLAKFYESVLELWREDKRDDFIVLKRGAVELVLVQARPLPANAVPTGTPQKPREATSLKLSFDLPSLEKARAAIDRHGGQLNPADKAWDWRGFLHLDGVDPEGNVFQVKERIAS